MVKIRLIYKTYCQVRAAVAAGQHSAGRGSVQWAADHHRGQERGWHVAPSGQEVRSLFIWFSFSHEQRCFSVFPIKNRCHSFLLLLVLDVSGIVSQRWLYQRNCVLCVGNEERGKRMTLVSSYSLEMA